MVIIFYFLIFFNIILVFLSFFYIGKKDIFSYINLYNLNYIFYSIIRPLYLSVFTNFESPYAPHVEKDVLMFNFVYLLIMITYIFINLGYYFVLTKNVKLIKISINENKFYKISIILLGIGVFLEFYLIYKIGGIEKVLLSLALRNKIFLVNNSFILVTLSKIFILVGGFGILVYLIKNKFLFKSIIILIFLVMITILFGGRGFVFNFILGYLILYHYLYNKIKLKTIFIIGIFSVFFLGLLGNIRDNLTGNQVNFEQFLKKDTASLKEKIHTISRVRRGFDFDLETTYFYLNNKINYFGTYITGITSFIPRNIFPEKQEIMGARIARDVYGINDYAITSTKMISIMLQWGVFALPIFSFIIGILGGYLYKNFIITKNYYFSILIYILSWQYVSVLITDLSAWMQEYFLILLILLIGVFFSKLKI